MRPLIIFSAFLFLLSCSEDATVPSGQVTYDTLLIPTGLPQSFLRIREVLAEPGAADENEAFRLRYYGLDTLNLDGWNILDAENIYWPLSGRILPDEERVFISGKESGYLAKSGDMLYLFGPGGLLAQSFGYTDAETGEWIPAPTGSRLISTRKDGKIISRVIEN